MTSEFGRWGVQLWVDEGYTVCSKVIDTLCDRTKALELQTNALSLYVLPFCRFTALVNLTIEFRPRFWGDRIWPSSIDPHKIPEALRLVIGASENLESLKIIDTYTTESFSDEGSFMVGIGDIIPIEPCSLTSLELEGVSLRVEPRDTAPVTLSNLRSLTSLAIKGKTVGVTDPDCGVNLWSSLLSHSVHLRDIRLRGGVEPPPALIQYLNRWGGLVRTFVLHIPDGWKLTKEFLSSCQAFWESVETLVVIGTGCMETDPNWCLLPWKLLNLRDVTLTLDVECLRVKSSFVLSLYTTYQPITEHIENPRLWAES